MAALATPGDFEDWSRHPRQLLLHARNVGVVKDPDFPPEFDVWANELKTVQPIPAAAALAPRPLLVVHGDLDDLTPLVDGRSLVAAHGDAEVRIIDGAGHELRHDPRAVAVFVGWLDRQHRLDAEQRSETSSTDGAADY
ncbi:MAG: alpha/beta fold hydrolase [Actinomycetes bacterium]